MSFFSFRTRIVAILVWSIIGNYQDGRKKKKQNLLEFRKESIEREHSSVEILQELRIVCMIKMSTTSFFLAGTRLGILPFWIQFSNLDFLNPERFNQDFSFFAQECNGFSNVLFSKDNPESWSVPLLTFHMFSAINIHWILGGNSENILQAENSSEIQCISFFWILSKDSRCFCLGFFQKKILTILEKVFYKDSFFALKSDDDWRAPRICFHSRRRSQESSFFQFRFFEILRVSLQWRSGQ